MAIEEVVQEARGRVSASLKELQERSAEQAAALRIGRLRFSRAEQRRRIMEHRRVRSATNLIYRGVENLCELGRSPEVQALMKEIGPIELFGWHLQNIEWDCHIRLEQERLSIQESFADLGISYNYGLSDPFLQAFGKRRLHRLAAVYYPFDNEDWRMREHELQKHGYIQGVEPVLAQILVDCGEEAGLRKWFARSAFF